MESPLTQQNGESSQHDLDSYTREVNRHAKRNFWCNVMDGNLWDFATSFIAFGTIIPVFVLRLGGNNLVVSLIPFTIIVCLNLPAFFLLHHIEHMERKKPFVLGAGAIMRSVWFFVAVSCFLLAEKHPTAMLIVFMGFLVLFFASDGANIPAWFDLVAKTVPTRVRGKMMSYRSIGGSVLGTAGGILAGAILMKVAYPLNYTILFFIAFVFYMASLGSIALVREPVLPSNTPKKTMGGAIRAMGAAIRGNRNFTIFIVARAAATVVSASTAFYVVYAMKKYALPESYAGIFTAVMVVTTIVFGPLIGMLADRRGHKQNFTLSMTASAAAAAMILFTNGIAFFYPAIVLLGIAQIALMVSELPMTVEFCAVREQPVYIAACQVAVAPVAFMTLGFGALADRLGYPTLFAVIGVLSVLGAVFTYFRLNDPRHVGGNAAQLDA